MRSFFSYGGIGLGELLGLALLIHPGQAEVFERDWKEPGDGLLTYDDVSNREWLDLSQTLLEQFAEPEAEFPEDHYANVVAELGRGGLFEGFFVATSDDVIALAESAGIDPSTTSFDANSASITRVIELLGVTVEFSNTGFKQSQGFLDEFGADEGDRSIGAFRLAPPVSPSDAGHAAFFVTAEEDLTSPSTAGVMLYRTAIPEPRSLMSGLVCIGATAVAASTRWRFQRMAIAQDVTAPASSST